MLEQHAAQNDIHALSLEVNIGNGGARTFYERHDFMLRRQFCMMTKNVKTEEVPLTIAS
ncbi:hypothetical protein VDA_002181 [Photobacterium damselae subsp. damselae CIP 102761]|uniref:N-acetyltransferase domain-containing protein n=2 Tax=Photobacterium damselae TaxID=38293 RepID=D0YY18_PHODD|nr:hypothetical protein VDA_002181 [Photobacterium damselae subsp. damselae CIP 102761]